MVALQGRAVPTCGRVVREGDNQEERCAAAAEMRRRSIRRRVQEGETALSAAAVEDGRMGKHRMFAACGSSTARYAKLL